MLIYHVHIAMKTLLLEKVRQWGFKVQVANLQQDTQQLAELLPYLPSDLPVLILLEPDKIHPDGLREFQVKHHSIIKCLKFLHQQHPSHYEVLINHDDINSLTYPDAQSYITYHIMIHLLPAEDKLMMEEEAKTLDN